MIQVSRINSTAKHLVEFSSWVPLCLPMRCSGGLQRERLTVGMVSACRGGPSVPYAGMAAQARNSGPAFGGE